MMNDESMIELMIKWSHQYFDIDNDESIDSIDAFDMIESSFIDEFRDCIDDIIIDIDIDFDDNELIDSYYDQINRLIDDDERFINQINSIANEYRAKLIKKLND